MIRAGVLFLALVLSSATASATPYGSAAWARVKTLVDCDNATNSKLLYDATTKSFSCGTDQSGSGLADGDKGDITVSGSGAAWAVDSGVVDFSELGGSATDGQIPNNITIDLATLATTATTANAGDSATSFFSSGEIEDARLPSGLARDSEVSAAYQPLATDLTRLVDNCALENDATPIPDSCVGDGSDGTSAGGGVTTVEDIDGTPTYTSQEKISFNQADGFVITNPVSTESQIDMSGMEMYTVFGYTGCGNTTDYMGAGSNNANCSATEGNVDIAHAGPTMTVGNLKCYQQTDTSCTTVFTIMKNGSASAASAATCTNVATCAASTTTDTIANGDTWSIRVVDNASTCTNGVYVQCSFTGTW